MINASDIRKIILRKGKGYAHDEVYFLHAKDVDTFIAAQERLHHQPGYNPHNHARTAHLTWIEVSQLEPNHDHQSWWTQPELGTKTNANKDNAATILGWKVLLQKCYPAEED